MTPKQAAFQTSRNVAEAVLEVINQRPEGSDGERLFLAIRQHISRAAFDQMMRGFVESQRVTLKGAAYFPGPAYSRSPFPRRL
jgi:hypothetical protein